MDVVKLSKEVRAVCYSVMEGKEASLILWNPLSPIPIQAEAVCFSLDYEEALRQPDGWRVFAFRDCWRICPVDIAIFFPIGKSIRGVSERGAAAFRSAGEKAMLFPLRVKRAFSQTRCSLGKIKKRPIGQIQFRR